MLKHSSTSKRFIRNMYQGTMGNDLWSRFIGTKRILDISDYFGVIFIIHFFDHFLQIIFSFIIKSYYLDNNLLL